jgi:hypothetical protein
MKTVCDKCLRVVEETEGKKWTVVRTNYSQFILCPNCEDGFWHAVDNCYPPIQKDPIEKTIFNVITQSPESLTYFIWNNRMNICNICTKNGNEKRVCVDCINGISDYLKQKAEKYNYEKNCFT